ncbi:hypothetical protein M2389_001112 [Microbacterium phyllosphaerae]|nr:hypothetical protein [Microbacterium phyllosphaerae]MCS3442336.1 hypothetical protein [Microbacterium phyllosphaerae]
MPRVDAALTQGLLDRAGEMMALEKLTLVQRRLAVDDLATTCDRLPPVLDATSRRAEAGPHRGGRRTLGWGRRHEVADRVRKFTITKEEDIAFVREVPEERPSCQAGRFGDLRNRGRREPLSFEEEYRRSFEPQCSIR